MKESQVVSPHDLHAVGDERGRIVVGIDGSRDSDSALLWAAAEAQLRHAALVVVHARFARAELLDSYPDMAAAEERIVSDGLDLARRSAPGLSVSGSLVPPPAGEALIQASQGCDLLVVGTHGRSGMQRLALGSVSAHCVHHARCPVVVVKPTSVPEPAGLDQSSADAAEAKGHSTLTSHP